VYLIYAAEDTQAAQFVASQADAGQSADIRPIRSSRNGLSGWKRAIDQQLQASDFVVIMLSPSSVESAWARWEADRALRLEDLADRDITLVPAIIENCEVPPEFADIQMLDARGEEGLARLRRQLSFASKIDWARLGPQRFEALVTDLLLALGFRQTGQDTLRSEGRLSVPDMVLSYPYIDPFGIPIEETWIVEIKFYSSAKADLKAVHQVAEDVSRLPSSAWGLLVTNGRLTSVTRHWLAEEGSRLARLRVIEGQELKRLLLFSADLIERYFDGRPLPG